LSNSLTDLLNQGYRGYGIEGEINVMVVGRILGTRHEWR